jgi:hypothetical protein
MIEYGITDLVFHIRRMIPATINKAPCQYHTDNIFKGKRLLLK